jgi:hypothetical protein
LFVAAGAVEVQAGEAVTSAPITFNTNFESGSLGKIEQVGPGHYVCALRGEQNAQGRNRQASWYYFRMDGVRDRAVTIELADLLGEYNFRPGTHAVTKDTRPLFSYDNQTWRHFGALGWDERTSRAIIRFKPERDRVWIAHIQPYTTRDLARLLESVSDSPHLRTEVIGKSAQGRDLLLVTATNFAVPDEKKKVAWLLARQHSWETGGSFVSEGAIRFILSDDPEARRLRDRCIFKFVPMVDPDGVARGGVRFNANGYDVNRHWAEVDLRDPEHLERMPEIWYVKKAIVNFARAEKPIDLLLYLHNEESNDWISDGPVEDARFRETVRRLYDHLVKETTFDSTRPPRGEWDALSGTSEALYNAARVPAVIMEQKVALNRKLGRYPTADDRVAFGRDLLRCMALAALGE